MTIFTVVAAVLLAAAPARAQLEAWGSLPEEDLHTRSYANWNEPVGELFAPCDKTGKLSIARPYFKDYELTQRDLIAFSKGMNAVKRYANIAAALKDGYLPVPRGFVPGVGLMLANPGLLKDGAFSLEKPDIITYVKKQDAPQFRLVGLVYVAGSKHPPAMSGVDFDERSRKKDTKNVASGITWDYELDMCVIVDPGKSVSIYNPSDTPFHCKDGTRFPKMWRLYTWPMVYNPNGLCAEQNPMVDFLDRSQKFGPLCQKPK